MAKVSAILKFPKSKIDQPVISKVIREENVDVNILQAHITPEEDGHMLVIFGGEDASIKRALEFLRQNDVSITLPTRNIVRDKDKCVHCTACVGQCSSEALYVDKNTFEVVYNADQCIACKLCIPSCIFTAIESFSDYFRRTGEL